MKKLFLLFFVFLGNWAYTQPIITELVISPTGDDNIVNVLVTTMHNYGHFYQDEFYDIENNIITLKICVYGNAATVISYVTTQREIVLPNIPDNFTLVCEIYEGIESLPCEYDFEDITDSATLFFSAPLEEDVILNVNGFQTSETGISIYPNPTEKKFFIESPFSGLLTITIYNLQGKQVKIFENQPIGSSRGFEVSDLPDGIYLLNLQVEDRQVIKKLIVRK